MNAIPQPDNSNLNNSDGTLLPKDLTNAKAPPKEASRPSIKEEIEAFMAHVSSLSSNQERLNYCEDQFRELTQSWNGTARSRCLRGSIVLSLILEDRIQHCIADETHLDESKYINSLTQRYDLGKSRSQLSRYLRVGKVFIQAVRANLPVPETAEPIVQILPTAKHGGCLEAWRGIIENNQGKIPSTETIKTKVDEITGRTRKEEPRMVPAAKVAVLWEQIKPLLKGDDERLEKIKIAMAKLLEPKGETGQPANVAPPTDRPTAIEPPLESIQLLHAPEGDQEKVNSSPRHEPATPPSPASSAVQLKQAVESVTVHDDAPSEPSVGDATEEALDDPDEGIVFQGEEVDAPGAEEEAYVPNPTPPGGSTENTHEMSASVSTDERSSTQIDTETSSDLKMDESGASFVPDTTLTEEPPENMPTATSPADPKAPDEGTIINGVLIHRHGREIRTRLTNFNTPHFEALMLKLDEIGTWELETNRYCYGWKRPKYMHRVFQSEADARACFTDLVEWAPTL